MNQVVEGSVIERAPGSFSTRGADLAAQDSDKTVHSVVTMQSNASSLLVAITKAASDPKIDMDKMERLWAMHQTMVTQERKAAFNAAMARAQAKMVPVVNNATNSHTNSSYAKLGAIHKAITPIYTEEGLAVSFDTETKNDADPIAAGYIRTVAYVSHSDGHSERRHIDLPPDEAGSAGNKNKTRVQAAGSTSSYARRYLCLMIFNVSTEDDNDGNGAGKKESRKEETGTRGNTLPEYAESNFNANLPAWTEMIQTGTKTVDAVIRTVSCKATLTEAQIKILRAIKVNNAPGPVTCAQVEAKLKKAKTRDELDTAADLIKRVPDEEDRAILTALYDKRKTAINK